MHSLGRFFALLAICQCQQLFLLIVLASESCIQLCGNGLTSRIVPFPFGFSSSCQIQLNCSSSHGVALIGDFPIRRLTPKYILVELQAKCNRPIESLHHLFHRNFAPTSRNGILLGSCLLQGGPCPLPETIAETHLDMLECDSKRGNTSCYVEDKGRDFIDYLNLTRINCMTVYSSISVEPYNMSAMSMEVEVVELEWWLEGNCSCSNHSSCTELVSPMDGMRGYRCECIDGYAGDGYSTGTGCRRAPAALNPAMLVSSKFPESARYVALTGGITAVASITMTVGIIVCYVRRRSETNTKWKTRKCLTEVATRSNIPMFSYKDIEQATCGFSAQQRLGTGAFGTVYAGRFPNRDCVAVKRIKYRGVETTEQVINEIRLLSSVAHPNLLRLLGCSVGRGEQILVYEFMPNGTLSQHLQGERGDGGLSWHLRLAIAVQTAAAVAHLHSAKPPIYHRDIKSTNILLDQAFNSKVADFGLSRLGTPDVSHVSTAPQGTPGYLDPQYHQTFSLSDRSDVYSFGVVLMEIITGMKPVDLSRHGDDVYLASLAAERIRKGRLDEIVDPAAGAEGDECVRSSVHRVAEVAFRCLSFHQDARPSMKEVAVELEEVHQGWCLCKKGMKSCEEGGQELPSGSGEEAWFSQESSPSASVLLGNVD